jgi:hypothetical protein
MLTLVLILLSYAVLGILTNQIGMLLPTLPVAKLSALNMSGPMCGIWFGIPVIKIAAFFVTDALTIATMMAVPGIVVATARLSDGNRAQADRKQPLDSPAS